MTQYLKSPDMITIAPDFSGIALDNVPAGYYRIAVAQGIGFHLVPVDPLQTIDKIYGSLLQHVPRIKQVFAERVGLPTSVILEGLKGSGKSLMMKTIAKQFVEEENGIVLLCNQAFAGDSFFEFLQKITQKKIVLMDEFDKVYNDKDSRNSILTLLDGTFASHTLFILTMNATANSGAFEFFHNRPGRVFFNIKFSSIDLDAIEAYVVDHLYDQDKLFEIMTYVKRFQTFNMDMLATLVREVNACPHLDLEVIGTYLNVKPDLSLDDITFNIQVLRNGINVTKILRSHNISDSHLKRFIREADTSEFTINLDSRDEARVTYIDEDDGKERTRSSNKVHHAKKDIFIDPFDDYLYRSECKIDQDKRTGLITITGKSSDDVPFIMSLTPTVVKRHYYAF